jgi:phosphate butyryltransferase
MTGVKVNPGAVSFQGILQLAREKAAEGRKVRAALITSGTGQSVEAFSRAAQEGVIEPVLIVAGDGGEGIMSVTGVSEDHVTRVADIGAAIDKAATLVGNRILDLLVADESASEPLLDRIRGNDQDLVQKGDLASFVAVIKPASYPKLLLLKTKLGVIGNMVRVAGSLGIKRPRIAVLAAVEVVYPQMPVTMEAAILAKMADRGQIKGAAVDGPLSFDVAMDDFAAKSKGILNSEVAGQADAFLAPNIEAASGVYSALSLFGSSERGGVVVGGVVPLVVAMRTDRAEERFNSIRLGVLAVLR